MLFGGLSMWLFIAIIIAAFWPSTETWDRFEKFSKYWFVISVIFALSPLIYEWAK